MMSLRPVSVLDTHQVTNQPPPLEGYNRFLTDAALCDAVAQSGADCHRAQLERFGALTGSTEVIGWGELANRRPPVLETHDRFGRRIDEVRFHPAYYRLMALGLDEGIASSPWDGTRAGHTLHAALSYLSGQVDARGPVVR